MGFFCHIETVKVGVSGGIDKAHNYVKFHATAVLIETAV